MFADLLSPAGSPPGAELHTTTLLSDVEREEMWELIRAVATGDRESGTVRVAAIRHDTPVMYAVAVTRAAGFANQVVLFVTESDALPEQTLNALLTVAESIEQPLFLHATNRDPLPLNDAARFGSHTATLTVPLGSGVDLSVGGRDSSNTNDRWARWFDIVFNALPIPAILTDGSRVVSNRAAQLTGTSATDTATVSIADRVFPNRTLQLFGPGAPADVQRTLDALPAAVWTINAETTYANAPARALERSGLRFPRDLEARGVSTADPSSLPAGVHPVQLPGDGGRGSAYVRRFNIDLADGTLATGICVEVTFPADPPESAGYW
jgi:PAS domain-containing protein